MDLNRFLIFQLVILCFSCGKHSNEDEMSYVRTRTIGNIKLSSRLIPLETRLASENILEKGKKDSVLNSLKKSSLFVFSIEAKDSIEGDFLKRIFQTDQAYQRAIQFYSSGLKNAFKLRLNNQDMQASLVHFERSFGMNRAIRLNVAFEADLSDKKHFDFSYEDHLLNIGIVNFKFSNEENSQLEIAKP